MLKLSMNKCMNELLTFIVSCSKQSMEIEVVHKLKFHALDIYLEITAVACRLILHCCFIQKNAVYGRKLTLKLPGPAAGVGGSLTVAVA